MFLIWLKTKRGYQIWKTFAEAWGELMMSLIFGLIYLTIFGLFAPLLRRRNSMRLNAKKNENQKTFWIKKKPRDSTKNGLRTMG